jgi:hypothetical protein
MPGFDGSGPRGQGSMTGGARGYCNPVAGAVAPGACRGYGPGFGRGRGRGFGYRRGYANVAPMPISANTIPAEQEAGALKAQAEAMKNALEAINRRIQALEIQD